MLLETLVEKLLGMKLPDYERPITLPQGNYLSNAEMFGSGRVQTCHAYFQYPMTSGMQDLA